jgi:hypothetical protein
MNREKWNHILKKYWGIPKKAKIVYFKNPNECNRYHCEMVNPTHKGILWGKRKKSNNWIRLGKVFVGNIWVGLMDISKSVWYYLTLFAENLDVAMCLYAIVIGFLFMSVLLNLPAFEGGVYSCLARFSR